MQMVEIRACANCKQKFGIEAEDFDFYKKIQVPPPTWCPDCRFARRMIWRNERNLTKRTCDLCKKEVFSMYGKDVPFPVYCPDCWRSDAWDPLSYGQDYDFSKPFFEQFKSLFNRVPQPSLGSNGTNLNCDFANMVQDVKNVYFSFSVIWNSEDVYYSNNVERSRQIYDSLNVSDSEIIYGSIGSVKNYNSRFCYWTSSSVDCAFMLDCIGCSHCLGCAGLRNQQYRIFNEQYSKSDYEKEIQSFNLGSYAALQDFNKRFEEFVRNKPRKYARIINSKGSTGDEILNSKNVRFAFIVSDAEDSKYLYRSPGPKQAVDACHLGHAELVYEHVMGGSEPGQELKFIIWGAPGQHRVSYSTSCGSSSYLFGCVGMRNKEYCVLNKQYSKEKYEALIPKIIEHMDSMPYTDKKGRVYKYGEFFPLELSPFAYNESVMQEHIPLTKSKAEELGYHWKEKENRAYKTTITAAELPDHIKDVPDSITTEVIGCLNEGNKEWCTGAFRIIGEELAFYRRMQVPLPRYCPNCRYFLRFSKRNPEVLWHRNCQCAGSDSEGGAYRNTTTHFHNQDHCPNEFESPYLPGRPEIVYCEQCYNAEVV